MKPSSMSRASSGSSSMEVPASSLATGRRRQDLAISSALVVLDVGRPHRLAGVQALGVRRSRRVPQDLTGGERRVQARVVVIARDGEPAQQVRPVHPVAGGLVGRHHALQHQQAGRVAEVRHHDVDQAAGHLVKVEGGADLTEGVIKQRVPHQRGIEELLVGGRRHAHDHQCADNVVAPAHRLDGDHGVDRVGAPGAQREHRRGLPAAAGGVEQPLQRRAGLRRRRDQVAQVGTDQGFARRGEDFQRTPVMLIYPPSLIYPDDQGPPGGVGKQSSDL